MFISQAIGKGSAEIVLLIRERKKREASPTRCETMSVPLPGSASPPHLVNDDGEGKERDMTELHDLVWRREVEEPSLMDERQVMERRQEIARIEQMGKVSVISRR